MFVPLSRFSARFVELKGRVPAVIYTRIAREAVERATAVERRAMPVNFYDLAERLEVAVYGGA
jgi:hypothetical protein